jgi:hypothetical protein
MNSPTHFTLPKLVSEREIRELDDRLLTGLTGLLTR